MSHYNAAIGLEISDKAEKAQQLFKESLHIATTYCKPRAQCEYTSAAAVQGVFTHSDYIL